MAEKYEMQGQVPSFDSQGQIGDLDGERARNHVKEVTCMELPMDS